MEGPVLVSDKKYNGKYVALLSFNDKTVVASGKDPARVMASAIKKGVIAPVFVYVPEGK